MQHENGSLLVLATMLALGNAACPGGLQHAGQVDADSGVGGDSGSPGPGLLDGGQANVGPYTGPKASSGCGLQGAPTGVLTGQRIRVGNDDRTYVLTVPAGYAPDKLLALVFGFHGSGGDGFGVMLNLHLEAQADGAAIFAYPDGIGGVWDAVHENGVDVQLFDALVTKIGAAYCIDLNRVFATGFSFGGSMANALGCFRGNVLRAIAPEAGGNLWPAQVQCRGQVPVWIEYGLQDPYLEAFEKPSRDFWIARNHCGSSASPVPPEPCKLYQGCDAPFPVTSCEWNGGHDWPPFGPAGVWRFIDSYR